ncbi:hypothetical protein OAX78_02280 [Planctomycetota bacterium]|nr:hypothetical protein [Planctomycetota bacterium]
MSDERLRELERRWKRTGSAEDEAAWLSARVRTGTITERRLQVAAYLGHSAAADALIAAGYDPRYIPPWRQGSITHLASGLSEFGAEVCARAALAMGPLVPERALDDEEVFGNAYLNRMTGSDREEARVASENWIVCPCADCSRRASQFLQRLAAGWSELDRRFTPSLPPEGGACRIASQGEKYERKGVEAGEAAMHASRVVGEAEARAALCGELVPWALGYSDPVRDRAESRRRNM